MERQSAMKFRRVFILFSCFSVFFCLHVSADEVSDKKLTEQANEFFEATLFDKAIPLYAQLLKHQPQPDIQERLAQAYFFSEQFQKAIPLFLQLLQENPPTHERVLLLATAYRKIEKFSQAIEMLKKYESFPFWDDQLRYEYALSLFHGGQITQAREFFGALQTSKQERLGILSTLYCTRTYLSENQLKEAERCLNSIESQLPAGDLLNYEFAFLKGKICFQQNEFLLAGQYFENSLPTLHPNKMNWYQEALFNTGLSYLKAAENENISKPDQHKFFEKAESALLSLIKKYKKDLYFLTLGRYYLSKAVHLNDPQAYLQAEKILSNAENFDSRDAQAEALLLRAEAAPTHLERDALFRHLTRDENKETSFYPKSWYLRALNNFEEAIALKKSKPTDANILFEAANVDFQKAFLLLKDSDPETACLAKKYQAQSIYFQTNAERYTEALAALETIDNSLMNKVKDPDDIHYIHALISASIPQYAQEAIQKIENSLSQYPNGKHNEELLFLLGHIYYRNADYQNAEKIFLKILDLPSQKTGDAYFWLARCEDKLNNSEKAKEFRQTMYEKFPTHPLAPEAYFNKYPYYEYVQGHKSAIKHLQALSEKFPDSPFQMHAAYLTGLDYLRDRKSPEGRWIRKKNLTAAIDSFQEVETVFEKLQKNGLLPKSELENFLQMRFRALLEKAQTNLLIAQESQEAKRKIYLEYAEEVFKQLRDEFKNEKSHFFPLLSHSEAFQNIFNEGSFGLAKTYIEATKDNDAELLFSEMLRLLESAKITRGYLLSRIWYEMGLIAFRNNDNLKALDSFKKAEDAAKGKVLSKEQMLNLWIAQSQCYRQLKNNDQALIFLSKVINDDAVSGLRLKAMLLRAEIYEDQERRELARKQLEALAKKGGEWAQKAQTKLEEEYGYK